MTEKLKNEYGKLLQANIEAQTIHIFYIEQSAKFSEEIRVLHNQQKTMDKEELEKLPEEERWKAIMRMQKQAICLQEALKLLDLIERQRDKAKRKSNETKQRLESFCKHHGIEYALSKG